IASRKRCSSTLPESSTWLVHEPPFKFEASCAASSGEDTPLANRRSIKDLLTAAFTRSSYARHAELSRFAPMSLAEHLCRSGKAALVSRYEFSASRDRAARRADFRPGRPKSGIDFQQSRLLPADDGVLDARRTFQSANVPLRRCSRVAPQLARYRPASRRIFRSHGCGTERFRAAHEDGHPRCADSSLADRADLAL